MKTINAIIFGDNSWADDLIKVARSHLEEAQVLPRIDGAVIKGRAKTCESFLKDCRAGLKTISPDYFRLLPARLAKHSLHWGSVSMHVEEIAH